MVLLRAFVDDSASDVGDRRLFLAALIHDVEQWASFSEEWSELLRAEPSIGYLKMAEAKGLRGQFNGWSIKDRDAKVFSFSELIEKHKPWGVYCSVSREEYARILVPVAPYPLKNPYLFCFWCIMRTAADYHVHLDKEIGQANVSSIEFIFDEQEGLGDDAALYYQWLKEEQDPEIQSRLGPTPIFQDDKEIVALQAADFFAWHVRRQSEIGGDECKAILGRIMAHCASRDIDANSLKDTAARMRKVPGVSSIQSKREWRRTRKVTRALLEAGKGPPPSDIWTLRYLAMRVWFGGMKLRLRRWWRR